MKIIGHRGAAGLALENTLPSLELARLLGVDAIEIDVRMTQDKKLVLCHDADMSHISDSNSKVSELTLEELSKIRLRDGQSVVPSLRQALRVVEDTPVIIELKQGECTEPLLKVLKDFPNLDVTIVSFKLNELKKLHQQDPTLKLYGLEQTKPFEIIQWAHKTKLNGVGLNFWLLNPLTYVLIKRLNLDIYAYTLNSRLLVKFVQLLYPNVAICTDHPEWFIKHPWLTLRSNASFKQSKRQVRQPPKPKVVNPLNSK